jgi:hypothetical protein
MLSDKSQEILRRYRYYSSSQFAHSFRLLLTKGKGLCFLEVKVESSKGFFGLFDQLASENIYSDFFLQTSFTVG